MCVDAVDEGTDIALECATLARAGAGGRCTPLSVIVLTLPRGRGGCGCAECPPVLPVGLRVGTPRAIIAIPGFVLATCDAVDAEAGMGSAEDIDGRIQFRLGRCGARGTLLLLAVRAGGTLLSFGRTSWRTDACGAAMVEFV